MKNSLFTAISVLFIAHSWGQNTPPVVALQTVTVDPIDQIVTITYDLSDLENDPCEVWLKVSENGGLFYETLPLTELTGDVSAAITPGVGKTITWDYSNFGPSIYTASIRVYASDHYAIDIQTMVDQVDSVSIKDKLTYIEGIRHVTAGPAHLNVIRDSIEANFTRHQLETERQLFTNGAHTGENILGRKAGAKDESITFVIDGHYDGVSNSPGADDNGSAVAGMLEVLSILSHYEFEHTIRFIGFDFEESGLIGSQRYVQNAIAPYEDIQGVLNFEMIGYYTEEPNTQTLPAGFEILFPQAVAEIQANDSRGDFLVVCGNDNSASLISAYVAHSETYVPDLKVIHLQVAGNGLIAPDLRRSDHAPFWDSGRKALMLTDGGDTRNPHYHTMGDTMGTLNYDFMTKVVKATLAALAELAIPISSGFDSYDLGILSVHHHHHDATQITVYPNPTNGEVSIQFNTILPMRQRLEVFDLQGKIVSTHVLEISQGESMHSIDLTHLHAGNYILNFQSTEATVSRSLIIQ